MTKKKTDIKPLNGDGQRDGYWETYFDNGNIFYKGNYINGLATGYWETYNEDGSILDKANWSKGKKIGVSVEYFNESEEKPEFYEEIKLNK